MTRGFIGAVLIRYVPGAEAIGKYLGSKLFQ
jgi:hypothetical protein